jgi:hypothetical protein
MIINKQVKIVTGIKRLIVSGLAKYKVNQGSKKPINKRILAVKLPYV